jgi:ABC-type glycerol-3-phosphate transport system substrate-binding protein
MNRILVALMAGALMLGAAGCGETATTTPAGDDTATTETAPATTEEAPAAP